jgi:uncharacterized protein (TIGR00255 family)
MEIKTLNNRFRDIFLHTPRSLMGLEDLIRKLISQSADRGRIEVWIQIDAPAEDCGTLKLHMNKAEAAFDLLNKLQTGLYMNDPVTLAHLLSLNVITEESPEPEIDLPEIRPLIEELTRTAMKGVVQFRLQEGRELENDLAGHLRFLEEARLVLESQAGQANEASCQKLKARLEELLQNAVDPARLAQEAAILAERMDISEEITRFGSHLKAFALFLNEKDPVGRRMEFLLQELNREVNTMGSKSAGALLTDTVLSLKGVLEKMREQVQNIE